MECCLFNCSNSNVQAASRSTAKSDPNFTVNRINSTTITYLMGTVGSRWKKPFFSSPSIDI